MIIIISNSEAAHSARQRDSESLLTNQCCALGFVDTLALLLRVGIYIVYDLTITIIWQST